ncbi:chaperone modulator CbpM [Marinicella sediminis]|nr:chaperone modulator CbpM [Marinicella sediminis]
MIKFTYSLTQLYQTTHLSSGFIEKCVEYGILDPLVSQSGDWLFEVDQLIRLKKAARLRDDLDLNWNGLALAIDLIDEVEQLRNENRIIKSRLKRFL